MILSRDFVTRLSRDNVAACDYAVASCDFVAQTNQTNMTDDDILAGMLVSVGCVAKRKRTISRGVQKRLDMEQFHHFGTVFVKEDRETGKVVQRPCLFMRQSRSVQLDSNLTGAASANFGAKKSRTRAAKSRDKIARVIAILGLGWGDYGQVDASARGWFIARVRVLELLW